MAELNDLVIEPMRKTVSVVTGAPLSTSRQPYPFANTVFPFFTIATATPGTSSASRSGSTAASNAVSVSAAIPDGSDSFDDGGTSLPEQPTAHIAKTQIPPRMPALPSYPTKYPGTRAPKSPNSTPSWASNSGCHVAKNTNESSWIGFLH